MALDLQPYVPLDLQPVDETPQLDLQPVGQAVTAKTTGYTPEATPMEGGPLDKSGKPIFTLDQFREGKVPFVTIAGDPRIPYGTPVTSPQFPGVPFMVNDTGGAFKDAGLSHFDIARDNQDGANADENNRQVQFNLADPNFALSQTEEQQQTGTRGVPQQPDGMIEPGNLDIFNRPVLNNPDGSHSTASTISIGTDKGEVLIPTVVNGRRLTNEQAIANYKATGQNFGVFNNAATADAYAEQLHNQMAQATEIKAPTLKDLPPRAAAATGRAIDKFFQPGQTSPPIISPEAAAAGVNFAAVGARAATSIIEEITGLPYKAAESGVEQSLSEAISGFTVPEQVASLISFAAPGVAQTYALGVLAKLPEQYGHLKDVVQNHGLVSAETAKAATEAGIQDLTGFLALKGAGAARTKFAKKFKEPMPGLRERLQPTPAAAALTPQGPLAVPAPAFAGLKAPDLPAADASASGTGAKPDYLMPSGRLNEGKMRSAMIDNNGKVRVGHPEEHHSDIRNRLVENDLFPEGVQPEPDRTGWILGNDKNTFVSLTDFQNAKGDPDLAFRTKYPEKFPKADEAAELSLAEKLKRVAKESGADTPQQFNFKGGSAFHDYLKQWADRLKGLGRFAKTVKRYAEASQVRDQIAATYDAIDNKAAYVAGQAGTSVRLSLPSPSTVADQAATFVRQAAGDRAGMTAKLNAIRGKGYDDVIDYALRNWDKLEAAANAAKAATDAVYNAEFAAGIDFGYREGYVKGVYEDNLTMDLKNRALDALRGGGRGGSMAHAKSKVFNDYAEAIAAGWKPRDLRLSVLTQNAVHNGLRLVNGQAWVESFGAMTMPDGKPIAVPMNKVEGRTSSGDVTFRNQAPDGYRSIQTSPGNLVAIHEDAAAIITKLTTGSSFPVALSKTSASIKHNMLAFDIYHGSRFGQMQMAFEGLLKPSYHKGLAVLDHSDADLARAVKAGEMSQREADWAKSKRPVVEGLIGAGLNAGKVSDALFRHSSPLLPFAKATSNWIFGKLSRGIITQSGVYAFERNTRLHPDWTPAQTYAYTAREVNTYYRNMGNQGLFKSKTMQDGIRTFFFAPQWFEGKARSEGRGYGQTAKLLWSPTQGGNISKGMGTGLVAYFVANQMVNMLTRGTPTWDNPEHGHKLDAWIPDFMQGTNGFFHSPLGVFAEITHDAIKAHERGTEPLSIPLEIGKSQLGPVYAVGRDIFGGVDFYGRPLHGFEESLKQAAADALPIPIGLKNRGYAGAAERNLFSFAGAKLTPAGSKVSNIYKLAGDFMAKNDIKVEHGNEPSRYMPLRQALQENRTTDAQAEYKKLLTEGPSWLTPDQKVAKNKVLVFQAMFPDKFTNSVATEKEFRKQLTRGELDIYNAALREKQNIWDQFRALPK